MYTVLHICNTCRKVLNKGVLLYIHFNLFLALLLALIVFVSGIESAKHITVWWPADNPLWWALCTFYMLMQQWLCTTVAAVLHYLFLCVFCWMLAEGIVLYMLVVRAFQTNFENWYYLILLGWGMLQNVYKGYRSPAIDVSFWYRCPYSNSCCVHRNKTWVLWHIHFVSCGLWILKIAKDNRNRL